MTEEIRNPNLRNRYPGVKPFTSDEESIFFGREDDIRNLYDLIFLKQMVVLYGKSGYGKSSLLNAGIIPKLKKEGSWKHFTIRFQNHSQRDAIENISPAETIKKILQQNVNETSTGQLDQLLPDENSFWYWLKAHQHGTGNAQFMLIFDQFEELFTYPKEQIEEFSEQLSQILYITIPLQFRNKMRELSEKKELSIQLNDYLYDKLEVKVVFSVRADRLSLINGLKEKHPYILQNCYELDALSYEQARQAIRIPAGLPQSLGFKTPVFEIQEAAVKEIINSVSDKDDYKVETSTLQIVCRYIEDELVSEKHESIITVGLIGDVSNIFKQYYEKFLSRLEPGQRSKIQHLIEDELIESGRRITFDEVYIKKDSFGLNDEMLSRLEESSLLRKERSATGKLLYEISHDSLVTAIEKVAEERRVIEEQDKKKELEQQIEIERKRIELLENLNKKAVFRYRLAIMLAITSLLIALVAFYYWRQSVESVKMAVKAENEANVKKMEAQSALFQNKVLEAKKLIEEADRFMGFETYGTAVRKLKQSSALLEVNYNLTDKDRITKDSVMKHIEEKLIICTKKVNETK